MLHYLRDSFICLIIDMVMASIIIGLNIYSDYKVQGLITLIIFSIFYLLGRKLFMKDWRNDIEADAFIASSTFILMCIFGVIFVFVLNCFNLTSNIVKSIVEYKLALNITAGVLVAIVGILFGKNIDEVIGEEPEWLREEERRRNHRR